MSEMVERVAAAMWEQSGTGSLPRSWELMHSSLKEQWRGHARGAIAAMREPTEAMLDNAFEYVGYRAPGALVEIKQEVASDWRAMIDAALKD